MNEAYILMKREVENKIADILKEYIATIDSMGGAVNAIEQGYMQKEIAAASYRYQTQIESGDKIIVGVNKFTSNDEINPPSFKIDDAIRKVQIDKINQIKSERDNEKVAQLLAQLKQDTKDGTNVMPRIIDAVEQYATLGEIADVFRNEFGEYRA